MLADRMRFPLRRLPAIASGSLQAQSAGLSMSAAILAPFGLYAHFDRKRGSVHQNITNNFATVHGKQPNANTVFTCWLNLSFTSGKYYVEFSMDNVITATKSLTGVGFTTGTSYGASNPDTSPDGFTYRADGYIRNNTGSTPAVLKDAGASSGDRVAIAVDIDAGKAWFYGAIAGWGSGDPENGTNPDFTFSLGGGESLKFMALVGNDNGVTNNSVVTVISDPAGFTIGAPSGFNPASNGPPDTPAVSFDIDGITEFAQSVDGSVLNFELDPNVVLASAYSNTTDYVVNNVTADCTLSRTVGIYVVRFKHLVFYNASFKSTCAFGFRDTAHSTLGCTWNDNAIYLDGVSRGTGGDSALEKWVTIAIDMDNESMRFYHEATLEDTVDISSLSLSDFVPYASLSDFGIAIEVDWDMDVVDMPGTLAAEGYRGWASILSGVMFNAANVGSGMVLSNDNQTVTQNSSTWRSVTATYGRSTGKLVFTATLNEIATPVDYNNCIIGVVERDSNNVETYAGASGNGAGYQLGGAGTVRVNGSGSAFDSAPGITEGDTIIIAVDIDGQTMEYYAADGSLKETTDISALGAVILTPIFSLFSESSQWTANFSPSMGGFAGAAASLAGAGYVPWD